MPMFLSIEQVRASLERLRKSVHPFFGMSFLAFKKAKLPIGKTMQVVFSQIAAAQLDTHYKVPGWKGYYNP
jgi:hypothetical protein